MQITIKSKIRVCCTKNNCGFWGKVPKVFKIIYNTFINKRKLLFILSKIIVLVYCTRTLYSYLNILINFNSFILVLKNKFSHFTLM